MTMDQFGQGSSRAAEYVALIKGILPLAEVSFVIASVVGLYRMRIRPLLRYPLRIFFTLVNMLLYSVITSFLAVSAVMLLPRVIPDPSRELERAHHGQPFRYRGFSSAGTKGFRPVHGEISGPDLPWGSADQHDARTVRRTCGAMPFFA